MKRLIGQGFVLLWFFCAVQSIQHKLLLLLSLYKKNLWAKVHTGLTELLRFRWACNFFWARKDHRCMHSCAIEWKEVVKNPFERGACILYCAIDYLIHSNCWFWKFILVFYLLESLSPSQINIFVSLPSQTQTWFNWCNSSTSTQPQAMNRKHLQDVSQDASYT